MFKNLNKITLREKMLAKTKNILKDDVLKKQSATLILNKIKKKLLNYQIISIYKAYSYEVPTQEIINYLIGHNKKVVIPKVLNKKTMIMIDYHTKKEILANQIDLFILPCLAYFKKYRLGHGFGHYDQYLQNSQKPKWLLAFKFQKSYFKKEAHDIKITKVITI